MSFLTPADVRIVPNDRANIITITASDAAYDRTRQVLMAIKDLTGLDITCISEKVAASIIANDQTGKGVALKTGALIPRTVDNEFVIRAYRSNVVGQSPLNSLSEELKQKFEEYGLSCRVFPC